MATTETLALKKAGDDEYFDHEIHLNENWEKIDNAHTAHLAETVTEIINVKTTYGAKGDGITDDITAIQNSVDDVYSKGGGIVFIPPGIYRISDTINHKSKVHVLAYGVTLVPDPSILIAYQIGDDSMISGSVKGLSIERTLFDGTTENVGFRVCNTTNFTMEDCLARNNKYGYLFDPDTSQMVAYSQFFNCDSINNKYNVKVNPVSPGYVNENLFIGGRYHGGENTDTDVWLASSPTNNNKWIGISMEQGAATKTQAVLIDGGLGCDYNVFEWCRTEGYASTPYVIGANCRGNIIFESYETAGVSDLGAGTIYYNPSQGLVRNNDRASLTATAKYIRNVIHSNNDIDKFVHVIGDIGNGTYSNVLGLKVRKRDTVSRLVKGVYSVDGTELFGVNSWGGVIVGTSQYDRQPLKLGDYHLWVDSGGLLRIKNGVPTSDIDGTIVGTQA